MDALTWVARETNFEWCLNRSKEFNNDERIKIQAMADLFCTGIVLNHTNSHDAPIIPFYSTEGSYRLGRLNYHTFNSLEYEGRNNNKDLSSLLSTEGFSNLPKIYKICKPCFEKLSELMPNVCSIFVDENNFNEELNKFLNLRMRVYKIKIRLNKKINRSIGWISNISEFGCIKSVEIDWGKKQDFVFFSGYLGYYFAHNVLTGDIRIY